MKRLVTRIICLSVLANSLLFMASCAANNIDRGAWLHDEEAGIWYQEVQLTVESEDYGGASRTKASYRETLWEIPGLNGVGIGRYPFPDGNWVISVTFSSQRELDDAMRKDIIPPLLEGIPVIVSDTPATYILL